MVIRVPNDAVLDSMLPFKASVGFLDLLKAFVVLVAQLLPGLALSYAMSTFYRLLCAVCSIEVLLENRRYFGNSQRENSVQIFHVCFCFRHVFFLLGVLNGLQAIPVCASPRLLG